MLHQVCRRGRLLASLRGPGGSHTTIGAMLEESRIDNGVAEAIRGAQLQLMPLDVYETLLRRLRGDAKTSHIRDHRDLPHPKGSVTASPYGRAVRHTQHESRTFSTHLAHPGNGSIIFRSSQGVASYGFIDSIWRHELGHEFLLVHLHESLSSQDRTKNPFATRPKAHIEVVYDSPTREGRTEVISSTDIIAHAAYRKRPAGTFGITRASIILHNTDRGRSSIIL
jgi:hypothetical protein